MASNLKTIRDACFGGMFALGLLSAATAPAYALVSSTEAEVMEQKEVVDAIYSTSKHETQVDEQYSQRIQDTVKEFANKVKDTHFKVVEMMRASEMQMWPYANLFKDMSMIKMFDLGAQGDVENALNAINYGFYSGYKNVENMDASDTDNPQVRGTIGAVDRYFYDLYMNNFCVEDSATDNGECQSGNIENSTNFHDYFLSESTWPTARVLDVMQMARRFFSGMDTRDAYVNDLEDRSNFIEARGKQMRSNMRMAVLNNLAARRAPVSRNASLAFDVLVKAYARTGQIRSVDLDDMCKQDPLNPAEAQICGMMSAPIDSDGTRLISQAAIDRVMQYDINMSPLAYDSINETGLYASGAMDRQEVILKAQLVAQAYREIELLKMKTALYAMNMMSAR